MTRPVVRRLFVVVVMAGLLALLVWNARHGAVGMTDNVDEDPRSGDAGSNASTPPAKRFVGVLLSERTIDVVARVDGVLDELPVKVGQRVSPSDLLAHVKAHAIDQELAMAEASARASEAEVARTRAEVTEADRQLAYKGRLADAGVASVEEVEVAQFHGEVTRLRVKEAEARLEEHRARIVELRRKLEATAIRAPFAGVVAARYLDPGASVQPQAKVLRLVGNGKPLVRFAVPQDDLGRVGLGRDVVATCSSNGTAIRARVQSIAPEVDPAVNLLIVEAEVTEGSGNACPAGDVVHVVLHDPTP